MNTTLRLPGAAPHPPGRGVGPRGPRPGPACFCDGASGCTRSCDESRRRTTGRGPFRGGNDGAVGSAAPPGPGRSSSLRPTRRTAATPGPAAPVTSGCPSPRGGAARAPLHLPPGYDGTTRCAGGYVHGDAPRATSMAHLGDGRGGAHRRTSRYARGPGHPSSGTPGRSEDGPSCSLVPDAWRRRCAWTGPQLRHGLLRVRFIPRPVCGLSTDRGGGPGGLPSDVPRCSPARPVPVVTFHGTGGHVQCLRRRHWPLLPPSGARRVGLHLGYRGRRASILPVSFDDSLPTSPPWSDRNGARLAGVGPGPNDVTRIGYSCPPAPTSTLPVAGGRHRVLAARHRQLRLLAGTPTFTSTPPAYLEFFTAHPFTELIAGNLVGSTAASRRGGSGRDRPGRPRIARSLQRSSMRSATGRRCAATPPSRRLRRAVASLARYRSRRAGSAMTSAGRACTSAAVSLVVQLHAGLMRLAFVFPAPSPRWNTVGVEHRRGVVPGWYARTVRASG